MQVFLALDFNNHICTLFNRLPRLWSLPPWIACSLPLPILSALIKSFLWSHLYGTLTPPIPTLSTSCAPVANVSTTNLCMPKFKTSFGNSSVCLCHSLLLSRFSLPLCTVKFKWKWMSVQHALAHLVSQCLRTRKLVSCCVRLLYTYAFIGSIILCNMFLCVGISRSHIL